MEITKERPLTNKQKAYVIEYCTNGYNASQAYKKVYPKVKSGYNSHGSRMMAKDGIKQAIAKYMTKVEAKGERTRESLDAMYQDTYDQATTLKQPSAAVSATTGIARLYGMDRDGDTAKGEEPVALSKDDIEQLRALARSITEHELQGPRLAPAASTGTKADTTPEVENGAHSGRETG